MQYWWKDFLEYKNNLLNGLLGNKTVLTIVIIAFVIMILILLRNKISEWFHNWIKKNPKKENKSDDEIKL